MRSVEIRNGRLFYYGSAVGYLEGDGITADPMFRREDLERWLERKNLPVRWVDGVYDRLASGSAGSSVRMPCEMRLQPRQELPSNVCPKQIPSLRSAVKILNTSPFRMGRLQTFK